MSMCIRIVVSSNAYLDYVIKYSWSHLCIQVVPSRPLTDAQLPYLGSGRYRDWSDIWVCNDAVKNICLASLLSDMGYKLLPFRVPRVVRLSDDKEVLPAAYSESGIDGFIAFTQDLSLWWC